MQPPVAVPANGGPPTTALVTRPDGANVTVTDAIPEGSPDFRHADASPAICVRAFTAALLSKGPSTDSVVLGGGDGFTAPGAG